jgi:hypothetical protein
LKSLIDYLEVYPDDFVKIFKIGLFEECLVITAKIKEEEAIEDET